VSKLKSCSLFDLVNPDSHKIIKIIGKITEIAEKQVLSSVGIFRIPQLSVSAQKTQTAHYYI
jgi:hypothetical protein